MRINKVCVRNFKSIIDTDEVILDNNITIVIGKNEQGKTNFLKALESFDFKYIYRKDDDLCYLVNAQNIDLSKPPVITIDFLIEENDKTKIAQISDKLKNIGEIRITKYFDNRYEIDKPKINGVLKEINDKVKNLNKIIGEHFKDIETKLNLVSKIDKQKHISWLKSLQRPDGGFSHVPDQASHITHTYFVVKALMELGALDQINKQKLIEFILSIQHPNGGFGHLPNQAPQAQFTHEAVLLLKELSSYYTENFKNASKTFEKTSLDVDEIKRTIDGIIALLQTWDEKSFSELIEQIKDLRDEIEDLKSENIQKKILDLIPNFVYFDSVDILGDKISIDEYLENKEKYRTFSNLFYLSRLDIDNVANIKDVHHRKRIFRNASSTITGLINESWKQEKVQVNVDIDGNEILIFIEDEAGAKADPPSRRSDGFRWYLSFYINFMAGTKGELKNAILLLDNPGWVLHPSGQRDLLEILEKISNDNQILIATHSPFLIDKNKLERIRIAERKPTEGTKIYEKFYDSIYDSLRVVRASIGADISDSLFGHKNNIIVEGYSDKVYLESVAAYLNKKKKIAVNLRKLMINGAGGADKIPFLLGWHKAEKYNTLAIVDNDNEGRKVITEINNRDIEIDTAKDILKLDEIYEDLRGKDLEIEDLFDEDFFNKCVNNAYEKIFEEKIGKFQIEINDLSTEGLKTKRYSKFFKDKNLGAFDKVKVALEIQKMLRKKGIKEEDLGNTIDNFEKLFAKLKERFKEKGVKL